MNDVKEMDGLNPEQMKAMILKLQEDNLALKKENERMKLFETETLAKIKKIHKAIESKTTFLSHRGMYHSRNFCGMAHNLTLVKHFQEQTIMLEVMVYLMANGNKVYVNMDEYSLILGKTRQTISKYLTFLINNKFIRKTSKPYEYEVNAQYAVNGHRKDYINGNVEIFNEILPKELTIVTSNGTIKEYKVLDIFKLVKGIE